MKQITFTSRSSGYGCSEPGDNSGQYVRADLAKELLAALEAARKELEAYEERLSGEMYNDPELNALIVKAKGEK